MLGADVPIVLWALDLGARNYEANDTAWNPRDILKGGGVNCGTR